MCRHEQGNESNKPGERRDPNVSSYKRGPSRGSYLFFLPWLLGSYIQKKTFFLVTMNVSMKAVTSGTQGTGVHWFDRIVSCSLRCFQWGRKVFPRIPTLRIISGVARGKVRKELLLLDAISWKRIFFLPNFYVNRTWTMHLIASVVVQGCTRSPWKDPCGKWCG